jgi:hypothetical protein
MHDICDYTRSYGLSILFLIAHLKDHIRDYFTVQNILECKYS